VGVAGGAAMMLPWRLRPFGVQRAFAQIGGGTLPPGDVPKYVSPLVKPPVFPRAGKLKRQGLKNAEYYEIAMRQFQQQILPGASPGFAGLPATTVWSYGPADATTFDLANRFFYPAFTIENKWQKPAVVKWVNGLVDADGNSLPHLLPVDQTLHWANPPGPRDAHGIDQAPYGGPVPMVTHVHGAHTSEESDGYAEAWYLPDAGDIPGGYHTTGTFFDYFQGKYPGLGWGPGHATFSYPNDQRATTLWYHDHTLGMTRVNVYAGPAGFWLIRGGPDDMVLDSRDGTTAVLPGPAPGQGIDPFGTFYEIPIAVQDRSFNADGSLFYPDNRAFFEGLTPDQLQIPFTPDPGCDGHPSDVAPIWNPEFFGNMMVVNGQTWPFLDVEQRRYRFRLLNGCNSRFLVLQFGDPRVEVWQIGAEGGFLPAPVRLNDFPADGVADGTAKLLMAPAERADVIVDFTNVPVGTPITVLNLGPDEPFGGFPTDPSHPDSTGQVMELRVGPAMSADATTPPQYLQLPATAPVVPTATRALSLNEEESENVRFTEDGSGNWVYDCDGEVFGPTAALLGTHSTVTGNPTGLLWNDDITENPAVGDSETWEVYNFTADAHPIHVHLVQFQVVDRQALAPVDGDGVAEPPAFPTGSPRPPEAWETGWKDTVISYPGEVTRIKMKFDKPGFYVWHCHIVEHEDNEMMRPYHVGPIPPDAPAQ
jgi:FtsP/CotA-like multicopper oxidase with cupredoxin domain